MIINNVSNKFNIESANQQRIGVNRQSSQNLEVNKLIKPGGHARTELGKNRSEVNKSKEESIYKDRVDNIKKSHNKIRENAIKFCKFISIFTWK